MFGFVDGSIFSLDVLDLAEYSTFYERPMTVHFIGYRGDGSVVSTDFTTDGVIAGSGPLADFETFYFGPEWSGLVRVEMPTPLWSLDNLVVSIPEPSSLSMLGLGGSLLALSLLRKRSS